jgi:hypothetical protein
MAYAGTTDGEGRLDGLSLDSSKLGADGSDGASEEHASLVMKETSVSSQVRAGVGRKHAPGLSVSGRGRLFLAAPSSAEV